MEAATNFLAKWGMVLVVVALSITVVAVLMFRFKLPPEYQTPLLVLLVATLLAALAAAMGALALLGSLISDASQVQRSLVTIVLALVLIIPVFSLASKVGTMPTINDISTDLDNPPVYKVVPSLRHPIDNSLDLVQERMDTQKAFYDDIKPLKLTASPDQVFDKALSVMADKGWDIVDSDKAAGHIEATVSTAVLNFQDDVVIRLTVDNGGTIVDMRSASRTGRSDLGVNSQRIREFFAALN